MRIAYGINGEGSGHATRSKGVIDYLTKKGHKIELFAGGRAYDFLTKEGQKVNKIFCLHLEYTDGRMDLDASIKKISSNFKEMYPSIKEITEKLIAFKPEVVISDFEPFIVISARMLGIPILNANNISVIQKTKNKEKSISKQIALGAANIMTSKSDWYVIPSFFFPEVKRKKVILTDPPAREEVIKQKTTKGKHITVYLSFKGTNNLFEIFKEIKQDFHVYGQGKKTKEKNIQYFESSNKGFLNDMAKAKAIITQGGFGTLSEAIYLKKPVFSIPLKGQFEQENNAHYIKEQGYGEFSTTPTKKDIKHFLENLGEYNNNLQKARFDPHEFARTVESIARKIAKEPDTKRIKNIAKILKLLT